MNADGTPIVSLVSRWVRTAGPHWESAVSDQWIVFTGYRPGSGHSEVFRIAPDDARLALLTFNQVSFDAAPGSLPGTP